MDTISTTSQARRLPWFRSVRLWLALAAALLVLVAVLEVTVTGPRVTVLWRSDIAPSDRLALERRYDLQDGEPQSDTPGAWQYNLGNRSRENVERLVRDPAAEDTGYIDRAAFTAEDPDVRVSIRPWLAAAGQALSTGADVLQRSVWRVAGSGMVWLLLAGGVLLWAARATTRWPRTRQSGAAIGLVVIAFAVSRAAAYAAGVRFDASPLPWYWQFIDPVLLKDRLLESLYYSHTQPPLYNLFLGLNLKMFPTSFGAATYVEYMALGLITAVALYVLLTELGLSPVASAVLAAAFAVSPATLVYENWLYYEYPTMTVLVVGAAALHRFLARDSVAAGITFFAAAAAAIYIRTTFQLVWLIVIIGALMLAKRPRLVLKCCAVPLLVVVLLYAKNAVLVGAPLTSSWFGMHMTRTTLSQMDMKTRRELVADGSLHSVSLVEPFSHLESYAGYVPLAAPTGIPVLDQSRKSGGTQNFNALSYVAIAQAYLPDALWVIRNRPALYRSSVTESLILYFSPPTDYSFVDANVQKLKAYDRFVTENVYLRTPYFRRIGLGILAGYFFALAYGALLLVRLVWQRRNPGPKALTIMFLSSTILYSSALSCLTEVGENQRQRFFLDPLVLAVVAAGLQGLAIWVAGAMRSTDRVITAAEPLSTPP